MTRDGSTDDPPGEHVPAAHVARRLGRDVRTIRAWIVSGVIGGVRIEHEGHDRWFVFRAAFLAMLPKKEEDTDAQQK